jgi:hypothetical protein
MADVRTTKTGRTRTAKELEFSAAVDRVRAAAVRLDRITEHGGDRLRQATIEALDTAMRDLLTP